MSASKIQKLDASAAENFFGETLKRQYLPEGKNLRKELQRLANNALSNFNQRARKETQPRLWHSPREAPGELLGLKISPLKRVLDDLCDGKPVSADKIQKLSKLLASLKPARRDRSTLPKVSEQTEDSLAASIFSPAMIMLFDEVPSLLNRFIRLPCVQKGTDQNYIRNMYVENSYLRTGGTPGKLITIPTHERFIEALTNYVSNGKLWRSVDQRQLLRFLQAIFVNVASKGNSRITDFMPAAKDLVKAVDKHYGQYSADVGKARYDVNFKKHYAEAFGGRE